MTNPPTVSDYTAVAEYLSKFNVKFYIYSIKEVENPADDNMMCFKYTVWLETHEGLVMRPYMLGSYSDWIRHKGESCWAIIQSIFGFARLGLICSYNDFCEQFVIEKDDNSRKAYNRAKRYFKRLVDLGLTRIDIAEICNHAAMIRGKQY